ncbi:IS1380 family transposase, partial [Brevibacterium sp. FAM 24630]
IAITLALGGDALSDSSVLRDEPDLYGPVASNPTITRLIRTLAVDADRVLAALNTARAAARARVWELSGAQAPNHETDASTPLIVD